MVRFVAGGAPVPLQVRLRSVVGGAPVPLQRRVSTVAGPQKSADLRRKTCAEHKKCRRPAQKRGPATLLSLTCNDTVTNLRHYCHRPVATLHNRRTSACGDATGSLPPGRDRRRRGLRGWGPRTAAEEGEYRCRSSKIGRPATENLCRTQKTSQASPKTGTCDITVVDLRWKPVQNTKNVAGQPKNGDLRHYCS